MGITRAEIWFWCSDEEAQSASSECHHNCGSRARSQSEHRGLVSVLGASKISQNFAKIENESNFS